MANPKHASGEIELRVTELKLLNKAKTPPVSPSESVTELPGEDLRLKHRYLDLRRPAMQQAMILRDRITKGMRDYFEEHGFLDIETPILGRSTPEGARDYLVPSRVHHGNFYALPQSPQLYKQILMIAGYDRYVQVARCFRDEDLRADRQPEFTQLDLEMAFIDDDDVMDVIDGLVAKLAKELLDIDVEHLPLPRMTYDEAMTALRFTTRPTCGSAWRSSTSPTSPPSPISASSSRSSKPAATSERSASPADRSTTAAAASTRSPSSSKASAPRASRGSASKTSKENRTLNSNIAKFFPDELRAEMAERLGAKIGDLVLFSAADWLATCKVLHGLRTKIGAEMKLYDPKAMSFSWVVEFPMFERTEDADNPQAEGAWSAMHHPFTAPLDEHVRYLDKTDPAQFDPGACRAKAYDLVINGSEAGGGTIRIHDPEVQVASLRAPRHRRRDRRRPLRLLARGPRLRRPAARRHRPGPRPLGDAPGRLRQHPRRDRLPEDAEGDRPDDRGPRRGRPEAAQGAGGEGGPVASLLGRSALAYNSRMERFDAIYEDGVIKPAQPLSLPDHSPIEVMVTPKVDPMEADVEEGEATTIAKQKAALEDLWKRIDALPKHENKDEWSAKDHDDVLYGGPNGPA